MLQQADKKLVLYADDDADDRMLLTECIRVIAPDYHVEAVPDGFSALRFLQHQPQLPSLLIVDLNMPGMSGNELMEKLKTNQQFQSLPVVVFTTSSNPADIEICARYGVDLITKPMNLKEFEEKAGILLGYCR